MTCRSWIASPLSMLPNSGVPARSTVELSRSPATSTTPLGLPGSVTTKASADPAAEPVVPAAT